MSVFASWVRDATLSFLNTLRRWKSTVAGLTNNCLAMSPLRYPSLTSRAICASCGVSTSAVPAISWRTCSPVAFSSIGGPFGESVGTHGAQHVVGGAQLSPRVAAATLAAQPLPVHQVSSGEGGPDPAPVRYVIPSW